MRRRHFLSAAGALAAWPLGVLGQQSSVPVIGLLSSFSAALTERRTGPFKRGLGEMGYTVGRNVALEVRFAESQYERLPALAKDLIAKGVRLLATLGQPALDAAREASGTIPIVFVAAFDPVRGGAVQSLARPGANVTGVTFVSGALGPKRLELLREIVGRNALIAMLANTDSAEARTELKDVEAVAASLQQPLLVVKAANKAEIDAAFAEVARRRAAALLLGTTFVQHVRQVVALAAQHRIPTIHPTAESAAAGGLMSYGASIDAAWVQAGVHAGRILRGAKPADLPVVQPDKFELVLNAKTAKALGLTFPQTLIARADDVIR